LQQKVFAGKQKGKRSRSSNSIQSTKKYGNTTAIKAKKFAPYSRANCKLSETLNI